MVDGDESGPLTSTSTVNNENIRCHFFGMKPVGWLNDAKRSVKFMANIIANDNK